MALLEIENLTFSYPRADAPCLSGVSLRVEAGEYIVLCGKSGSGKTTLLRHLKSALTPTGTRSGCVRYRGEPLASLPPAVQAGEIGFVMQSPDDQIVTDKVWHELAFGLESLGCEQALMRARVAEMASYFGIQDWFHRDVATLSGGQKQLLNLASVMATQPKVLVLDEPTSQLDPIAAGDFLNTVRKLNRELGTTVILTEHRTEEVFPVADRVVVMDGGRITADDSPRAVCAQLLAQGSDLADALPTPARVFPHDGEPPLTVREGRLRLERAAVGATRTQIDDPPEPPQRQTALRMKEVWFRYERETPDVLRGVNIEVPDGTLYAVVGGNGTGKSTLLKAACGICKPYRGKIQLFGKPLASYKPAQLYRGGVAMLPQDPKNLFVKKTVREELAEMCADEDACARVAALCALEPLLSAHPYDLSGGEQQRTALAKVLLTEPRLLLLDEPTKGMDAAFKRSFAQILRTLTSSGVTVLLVSHDIAFCARNADRVGMFFDGELLSSAPPHRFFGGNSFYTTAAARMSRGIFTGAITAEEVAALLRGNSEAGT